MSAARWTRVKGWLAAVLARPVISEVRHVHNPVAIAGGNTPLRIVAVGFGLLYVGTTVRFVRWGCDEVFYAPVDPAVVIHFVGLGGVASYTQALAPRRTAPVRVEVRGHERDEPPPFVHPVVVKPPKVAERAPLLFRSRLRAPAMRNLSMPGRVPAPRARTVPRLRPFPQIDFTRRNT